LLNISGCDSVHTLVALINYTNTGSSTQFACDSYDWNGQSIISSGSYNQTFTNVSGCDSVHTLLATIGNTNTESSTQFACDSYDWNGQIITSSGFYYQNFTNSTGCDSVHALELIIGNINSETSNLLACYSYDWNGQIITSSGSYNQTFTNLSGCDSVHNLILTISPTSTLFDTVSICNGETYIVFNSVYTNSGNYIDSIDNSSGCFSFIYTNLTVLNPISVNITQLSASVLGSTVTGGFIPYNYLWNNFSITPNSNIISNGLYWLLVTDSLSCPNDTVFYEVTNFSTSISELGIDALSIYPNPSSDLFNIEFNSYIKQSLVVRLVNIIGEYVLDDKLDDFEGGYKRTIDLSAHSKGIYFLKIETNDGIINKKLILQ